MDPTHLTLKTEYWDDPAARAAFKAFILEIHGLNFNAWESAGCWDDAYTPFSYFEGDEVVASVCVYLLDVVIEGAATRLAQISGVGTAPRWRRRGLNRRLTEIGLDWARGRHEGVFLFADDDAVPFYRRCGFEPIEEYVERTAAPSAARRAGALKLDPRQRRDLDRIVAHARRRAAVSDRFGVLNARLLAFHALYPLRDNVFEIPDLECVVFFSRAEGLLKLFDVVGARVPRLEQLYPYIADVGDREIELHFHADKLGLEQAAVETIPLAGNNPFVRGAFPAERPVFPYTCRA